MRRQMIESDVVECVIGLGPNLFYNSPMEACLLMSLDLVVQSKLELLARIGGLKASVISESFERSLCERVRLGDISTNLDSARRPVKKSERIAGAVPYYGASGVVDYVEQYTHAEPILLVSEDGENLNSRKPPIAYEVDGKLSGMNLNAADSADSSLKEESTPLGFSVYSDYFLAALYF